MDLSSIINKPDDRGRATQNPSRGGSPQPPSAHQSLSKPTRNSISEMHQSPTRSATFTPPPRPELQTHEAPPLSLYTPGSYPLVGPSPQRQTLHLPPYSPPALPSPIHDARSPTSAQQPPSRSSTHTSSDGRRYQSRTSSYPPVFPLQHAALPAQSLGPPAEMSSPVRPPHLGSMLYNQQVSHVPPHQPHMTTVYPFPQHLQQEQRSPQHQESSLILSPTTYGSPLPPTRSLFPLSTRPLPEYNRYSPLVSLPSLQSQPTTPVGPTPAIRPRPPGIGFSAGFGQPSSPSQSQLPSVAPSGLSPQLSRMSNGGVQIHHNPDSAISPVSHPDVHQPRIPSERERSLSASPHSIISPSLLIDHPRLVPFLPATHGRSPATVRVAAKPNGHTDVKADLPILAPQPEPVYVSVPPLSKGQGGSSTPLKRKMEDRDLGPDEVELRGPRSPRSDTNNGIAAGGPPQSQKLPPLAAPAVPIAVAATAAVMPATRSRKQPRYYSVPPLWSQSCKLYGQPLKHENFQLLDKKPPPPTEHWRSHSRTNLQAGGSHSMSDNKAQQEQQPTSPHHDHSPLFNLIEEQAAVALLPWAPTMEGGRPASEVNDAIADWLYVTIVAKPSFVELLNCGVDFEIEAKLGTICEKDTDERVRLQVSSECLIPEDGGFRFQGGTTAGQQSGLHGFLHSLTGAQPTIQQRRRREIDRFYGVPPHVFDRLPPSIRALQQGSKWPPKLRITYDEDSREITNQIIKFRIEDRHIHFPTCPLDCRISINAEVPWRHPGLEVEQLVMDESGERHKDRMSYRQGPYTVDLTLVTQSQIGSNSFVTHEVEIELSTDEFLAHAIDAFHGRTPSYRLLIGGLVDNTRMLLRKARSF